MEAESCRALIAQHAHSIATLSQNADDMRKFALMSIEDARGEARALKERCAELELQQHRDARAMDAMRKAHYRAAASTTLEGNE